MKKGKKKQKLVIQFPSEYEDKRITITFIKRGK